MENVKYTSAHYTRTFGLGNFENEKIGLTAEVLEGADMLQVMNQIRNDVEAVHSYRRDLKTFENAQHIVKNKADYIGRDVMRAEQTIEEFYTKYPFHRPADVAAALQLNEAPDIEVKKRKPRYMDDED